MITKMTTGIIKLHTLLFALLILTGCEVSSNKPVDEFEEYIDLAGEWKFSIGDDLQWSDQTYNDNDWDDILVPSSWEDEGFHGYDGFAWYRKDFDLPDDYDGRILYLYLGYIDDADEVYINGNLVGSSGSFPPFFTTAYTAFRKYIVPGNILNKNKNNVVSIRVFDSQLSGGILSGEIGLFINKNEINPDLDLTGKWKFNTGDNSEWKEKNYNDGIWLSLFVPSNWDNQGFRDYDGFAWYRKEFV
ncbi:MAG TPA: beta galactosidase jelly roll domain-containing protein, partial [Ignavibacteriaceae bacterium]|nr:beta galactosidase jelly roll domain-containing protein [Ignavibacteriaceae bacterium]